MASAGSDGRRKLYWPFCARAQPMSSKCFCQSRFCLFWAGKLFSTLRSPIAFFHTKAKETAVKNEGGSMLIVASGLQKLLASTTRTKSQRFSKRVSSVRSSMFQPLPTERSGY
jgi:hypothetical protein